MANLERDVRRLARLSDDRLLDEADRSDEAGARRRAQFAKRTKKTIAVTDIEIPNNYAPVADYDKFLALVEDIRANGIKERIEVTERRGRYVLEHGRARLEAAKRLKHETIKVAVLGEWRPQIARKSAPTKPLPNEWVLVGQARNGDIDARNQLLEHYYRVATFVGAQNAKGLEFSTTDGVAVDAINAAIETWNPKKTSLSTWIGTKVRYLVADIRRTERNYLKTKKDFESGEAISKQKVDHLDRRKTQNSTARRLIELGLEEWLKRRKGVSPQDRKIAKALFIDGGLPGEVSTKLGLPTGTVRRARARIIKQFIAKANTSTLLPWNDYRRWEKAPRVDGCVKTILLLTLQSREPMS